MWGKPCGSVSAVAVHSSSQGPSLGNHAAGCECFRQLQLGRQPQPNQQLQLTCYQLQPPTRTSHQKHPFEGGNPETSDSAASQHHTASPRSFPFFPSPLNPAVAGAIMDRFRTLFGGGGLGLGGAVPGSVCSSSPRECCTSRLHQPLGPGNQFIDMRISPG